MLYSPESALHSSCFAYVVSKDATKNGWPPPASGFIPGGTIPLSQIQIGETTYRLRQPVQGEFVSNRGASWEFWVERFSPAFMGQGPSAEAAYEDWRDQVHESFQDLYRKRPFEMTKEERWKWGVLEDLIDVVSYQNEAPVLVRQFGQITQARPLPRQITWVDGSKESAIDLDLMPAEFAGYKPGQWFEAIVERDRLTWRLRRVRYVHRTPSLRTMSQTVLSQYWSSLDTIERLPESKRDWTRP